MLAGIYIYIDAFLVIFVVYSSYRQMYANRIVITMLMVLYSQGNNNLIGGSCSQGFTANTLKNKN